MTGGTLGGPHGFTLGGEHGATLGTATTVPLWVKVVFDILAYVPDAITSLEYYIEELGLDAEPNPELLRLADTSLQDVGL